MITNQADLDDLLSAPSAADIDALHSLEGPLLILGAAGKMGPSLARRARRALDTAGNTASVVAVSRFSNPGSREIFREWNIETIACELLEPGALDRLPDAPNVIFMAGRKFGSAGNPALTWAVNTHLAGLAAHRYRNSRIAAFSSGNVYPLVPISSGGATEQTPTGPVGEYAQSVLGRERMFEYVSNEFGAPVTLLRLNYAVELRYGVLLDIALKVHHGQPIDLSMGHVNVIWQGDANSVALRSLARALSPPFIVNVTGAETLRVRDIAREFSRRFSKEPHFTGAEHPTALLSNSSLCQRLFGPPSLSPGNLIDLAAAWVLHGGATLDKPTHFEMREGKF